MCRVSSWLSKIYFISFWTICVLIALNLFFAMVFRLVDLARVSSKAYLVRLRVGGESPIGDDPDDPDEGEIITLLDGVYSHELGSVNATNTEWGTFQLTRGNSTIFSEEFNQDDALETQVILETAAASADEGDAAVKLRSFGEMSLIWSTPIRELDRVGHTQSMLAND